VSIQPVHQGTFDFFGDLPVVVEVSDAPLTSDAGLLPIREFDQKIGWTRRFAEQLRDRREPELVRHAFVEMTQARIYGILADYVDQNDHDTLRSDPLFKLLAGRAPDGPDLASQPTLSRFENAIDIPSLKRLADLFLDAFVESFAEAPKHLTLDMDAVDDPAHGQQQLALFHGFFDQYQYFPNFITCAENQQFLLLALRHGSAHAALAADSDLETVVTRLRQAWPDVRLHIRGDAGYGLPKMYEVCERLGVDYTFGIAANAVLKKRSDALLEEAVRLFDETKVSQRLFGAFWYQANSWPAPRWVIVKAEANAQGTNRRFVVSNRPGAQVLFEAAYDEYAMRGESENRNKEFACGMSMDRTSDHRFLANYFRLYLHAAALNLLVRLRREIAAPPPSPLPEMPTPVLDEPWRKKHANARRRTDPLGAGQPCTWRSLLIKVAAEVIVSSRRIVVRLSSAWPHLEQFRRVCLHVLQRSVTPLAQSVSSG
jgi:hypothetical protein